MVKATRLLFMAHCLLDFLTSAHSKKYMYRSHNLAPHAHVPLAHNTRARTRSGMEISKAILAFTVCLAVW